MIFCFVFVFILYFFDFMHKFFRYNNDFQKKFYFSVDFWETLNYNRTSWDFSCKDP